ncbi:tubby C-terminal-like domain-containing protein [Kalaharituber pfeilii]|nr:tubby C-terminal-like domain-containing protein [Kalaharituber pfeilii]
MGLFGNKGSSNDNQPLAPAPFPIGVTPQYISQQEIVLKLREKTLSLSGDSFDITSAQTNQQMFKCNGSVMSLHSKKLFTDPQGNPLLTIARKIFTIHTTFNVYRGKDTDDHLFTVRSHFTFIGTKMTVSFRNQATNQDIELKINGDFFQRNARITLGENGPVVARIDRSFLNLGQVFADNQTYYLRVAPNVDGLMMAAICVCLDEKAESK